MTAYSEMLVFCENASRHDGRVEVGRFVWDDDLAQWRPGGDERSGDWYRVTDMVGTSTDYWGIRDAAGELVVDDRGAPVFPPGRSREWIEITCRADGCRNAVPADLDDLTHAFYSLAHKGRHETSIDGLKFLLGRHKRSGWRQSR